MDPSTSYPLCWHASNLKVAVASAERSMVTSIQSGLVARPHSGLRALGRCQGIEFFKNAAWDLSASNAFESKRSRLPAPQLVVALLRGDGAPELGEYGHQESESRPLVREGSS